MKNDYLCFKLIYMTSGKYRCTYKARILSWENGIVHIRDEEQKEHTLKEKYIRGLKPTKIQKPKVELRETIAGYEQQDIFYYL